MADGNGHEPNMAETVADDLLTSAEQVKYHELLSSQKEERPNIATMGTQQLGVILRTLTPPDGNVDDQIKQALVLSELIDDDEVLDVVAAIQERKLCGVPLDPIIHWLLGRVAVSRKGPRANRVNLAYEALGKVTIHSNVGRSQPKNDRASIS